MCAKFVVLFILLFGLAGCKGHDKIMMTEPEMKTITVEVSAPKPETPDPEPSRSLSIILDKNVYGQDSNIAPKVKYYSSDSSDSSVYVDISNIIWDITPKLHAEVESDNTISLRKLGNVTIIAEVDGVRSESALVEIVPVEVTSVSIISKDKDILLPYSSNMMMGGARQLYLQASLNNGKTSDVTQQANWTVSDNAVLNLDEKFISQHNKKGLIKAIGLGGQYLEASVSVSANYQGFQDTIDLWVYDADITNYPTQCGVNEISITTPEGRKLTFRCPPIGERSGDNNSTQVLGSPYGIMNAILPLFTFNSAKSYCEGLGEGYRLPYWVEHLALNNAINTTYASPYTFNLEYGWPQLDNHWLLDDSPAPGRRYIARFTSAMNYLADETSFREVTALCVKQG